MYKSLYSFHVENIGYLEYYNLRIQDFVKVSTDQHHEMHGKRREAYRIQVILERLDRLKWGKANSLPDLRVNCLPPRGWERLGPRTTRGTAPSRAVLGVTFIFLM